MPAYVVASMAIHDPETYRKYTDRSPALIKKYGGKFLTRGDEVTAAEGEPFTDRMVILEFPSKKHIEDWLSDPDYVAAAKFRHASSICRLLVQEGVSNTENPDPKVK